MNAPCNPSTPIIIFVSPDYSMEKIVLGVSGVVALGTCLYTINRGTNGFHHSIDWLIKYFVRNLKAWPGWTHIKPTSCSKKCILQLTHTKNTNFKPKLAAYMFAGRAFGYGSAIAVASTITLCCAIALSIGATNVKLISRLLIYK